MKPVLFIPGFPASTLELDGVRVFPPHLPLPWGFGSQKRREALALLDGTHPRADKVVAGEPIRDVLFLGKQSASLYDLLREYGYVTDGSSPDFRSLGWNWRQGIYHREVQLALTRALDQLGGGQRGVVTIAHSTGGLVLRRYLEDHPEQAARLEHVLCLGVPWGGNLKALHYLDAGEAFGLPRRFGFTAREVRSIMRSAQTAYDLLPPATTAAPPLVVRDGAAVSPLIDRRWVEMGTDDVTGSLDRALDEVGRRPKRFELTGNGVPRITNVVGWGVRMVNRRHLDAAGRLLPARTDDADDAGDGTASEHSARWIEAKGLRTLFLPIGIHPNHLVPNRHSAIWDGPPMRPLFDDILRDQPLDVWVSVAGDGNEDRGTLRKIRCVAQDPQGMPLPGASVELKGVVRDPLSFSGERLTVQVPIAGLDRNWASGTHRFKAVFRWHDGAKRKIERSGAVWL